MENQLELIRPQKRRIGRTPQLQRNDRAVRALLIRHADAGALENRFQALQNTGRVEFGEGILKKLIYAFCDSPFMTQQNYEETISDLQEFLFFKNESLDQIPTTN
jgi:hypothetical protein